MKRLPIILCLVAAACSCHEQEPSPTPPAPPAPETDKPTATTYVTDASGKQMEQGSIVLGKPSDAVFYKVSLDGESYQSVDGFGFAITHASCYNLLLMPQADRTALLEELFSREKGIGSSLARICIGGSDFSMDEYTWCDEPGMENFAVHGLDEEWLFPILDEIMKINPAIRFIGSPWSCPRWMKVGDDLKSPYDAWTGGRLNPLLYKDYADYFVRWIREMESRGYPIYAVTLQNEPLNRGNSMSLYMGWKEQRDFIKEAVGPAFQAAGLKTKILLFDHNYNYDNISAEADYPIHVLEDADAARYVAGSAWHNYGGSVTTLDKVHSRFPDKDIFFTEASIGEWGGGYNYVGSLINDFRDNFLGTLGRFGKGVTLWNLMLDSDHKPFRAGGCSNCLGALTLSTKDHTLKGVVRNSHYYNVAHCSKVLAPGAVRLGTSGFTADKATYQWYRNPDGSYAIVALNEGSDEVRINFVTDRVSVPVRLPAKSLVSVIWKE